MIKEKKLLKKTLSGKRAARPLSLPEEGQTHLDWNKIFHGEFGLSRTITPMDILDSWRQFSEKTKREWKRFIGGANDIDTSIVPEDVLAGWTLCRKCNLDAFGQTHNPVLTGDALQKLLSDNQLFITTSQPFLNRLYRYMKTTSFIVSLFDRNGYLLQVMQDDKYVEVNRQHKWHAGALWTEEYGGNNSVGSVIRIKKPLQILGPQHYMQFCHGITTSSAPIFDPID